MKRLFIKSVSYTLISLVLIINSVGVAPAYAAASSTPNELGSAHSDHRPPAAPIVNRPPSITNDTTPVIGGKAEEDTRVRVWYVDDQGNRIRICRDWVDTDDRETTGPQHRQVEFKKWSCTSNMVLPEGEITLVVNARDRAGNVSKDTVYVFTIVTDTIAPAAPVVTSPVGITNDATPTITGTAEPGSSVNVRYLDDLGARVPICQDVFADASGNWSCTSSVTLPEREIEIVVNATDPAGNTSSDASFFFTVDTTFVDTTPPTVSSLVRADPNPSTDPTIDYTITFSEPVMGVDASDFAVQVTGTIIGAGIANVTGSGNTYTVTVDTGSGTGTLGLTVPVTATIDDLAGNPLAGLPYTSGEIYTIGPVPTFEAVTVGVFRTADAVWNLRNSNSSGAPDISTNYGIPIDYPVVGDWDGNGTDTIGIFRNGVFYLSNSNTSSIADIVFAFGIPGDQPIAGDWDDDGIDTVGLYRSSAITFYLRNDNSAGVPDMSFALGLPGDVAVAGDWDGNGQDSIGVFRPSNGTIFLNNSNAGGFADLAIAYGIPGDKPVLGDWNNDGIDTIGVYRNNTFYLRNSNETGFADLVFALTTPGDLPVAGNWDALP